MKKGPSGICECHKAGEVHHHTGGLVSHSPERSQGLLYGKETAITLQSARSVYINTLEEETPECIDENELAASVSRTTLRIGKADIIQ